MCMVHSCRVKLGRRILLPFPLDLRKHQSFGYSELFLIRALNLRRVRPVRTLQRLAKQRGSCQCNETRKIVDLRTTLLKLPVSVETVHIPKEFLMIIRLLYTPHYLINTNCIIAPSL